MKKLLSLLLVALVAVGATAQDRKYWDFRTLSQETIDNILADSETWTPTMKDDGTFDRAADAIKISGELTANGTPIKELQGLTFGTAGLSKNNNFMIATNRFRMTRNNMEIIFPKLLPGQTVTIRGRSANGSKSDRGFKSGNDNLEYISGPKDGLCIGNQVEGYGSADYPVEEDGNYTLVWKVREDLGTTEPVDVVIKLVTGGLDMAEIWIDNGNDDQVEEIKKIAYLYTAKDGYNVEDDVVYNILSSVGELTTVDITNFTGAETDTVAALESNYDLLVISETISSTHAWKNVIKGMVNRVPMLNLKSFFYKNWGWGAGANPATSGSVVLTNAGANHPLFAELGYAAGEELALYEGVESGNIIQGYTISEGSFIEGDSVLATVGGQNAIHVHGSFNTYMLFPLSSDAVVAGVAPTEDCQNLWMTIIDYLADTKSKVRQANKPAIKQTYNDGVTIVEFTTSIEGATIYYTVDGTEPTTASAVYTEALKLTEKATVKAMIVASGYNNSDVASAEVVVKVQAKQPVITVTDGENGTKIVTMVGDSIHYNLSDAVPTSASPVYTEPLVITRSTDICAIGVGKDMLDSEPVLAAAEIAAFPFRKDTLATITFEASQGFVHTLDDGTEVSISKKGYLWGVKKAWSYYYANGDSTTVNQDVKVADFGNGWVAESKGQVVHMHSDGSNTVGGGYGPATPADADFVKGGIQFLAKASGDPYSACLYTNGETTKYQGPFDIAVWMCSAVKNVTDEPTGTEDLQVSVSTDGTTWTVVDTLSIPNQKAVRRMVAHYDGKDAVYVKFAHAQGAKCMLMQIQILGEGGTSDICIPEAEVDAEVVSVEIYNLAGVKLNAPAEGLNIVRKTYSDGTVKVVKVMNR